MKENLIKLWHNLAKMVVMSLLLVIFMGVLYLVGQLSVVGGIVLGTAAIVFAITGLRE